MSEEVTAAQPELEIMQSIRAEAEARGRRAQDSARNTIEAEDAKAGRELEEATRGILAKADETARKVRARAIATANVEAQRILLRAREAAVDAVVLRIAQALQVLREDSPQYRACLAGLAAEAVQAIGEAHVHLFISGADQDLADTAFVESLQAVLRERLGRELVLSLDFSRADLGGGCMAASLDGRVVFDNTFSKRLERMRSRLRTSIVKEMTKSDE